MTVTSYKDLPLAAKDREWDGAAAERRVRHWAGAEDGPNARYRDAHIWYDSSGKDKFGSYKLLVADVVGDELKVVPRAVMAAGGVIDGARGGVDLPDADREKAKSHLARYYRRFDQEPPWER